MLNMTKNPVVCVEEAKEGCVLVCPCCGMSLVIFEMLSDGQNVLCPYCNNKFAKSEKNAAQAYLVRCPACGEVNNFNDNLTRGQKCQCEICGSAFEYSPGGLLECSQEVKREGIEVYSAVELNRILTIYKMMPFYKFMIMHYLHLRKLHGMKCKQCGREFAVAMKASDVSNADLRCDCGCEISALSAKKNYDKALEERKRRYDQTILNSEIIENYKTAVKKFEQDWSVYTDPTLDEKLSYVKDLIQRLYGRVSAINSERTLAAIKATEATNVMMHSDSSLLTLAALCVHDGVSKVESSAGDGVAGIMYQIGQYESMLEHGHQLKIEFAGRSYENAKAERLVKEVGVGSEAELPIQVEEDKLDIFQPMCKDVCREYNDQALGIVVVASFLFVITCFFCLLFVL